MNLNLRKLGAAITLGILVSGCSPVDFTITQGATSTNDGLGNGGGDDSGVKEVLKTMQPTLAVRGAACLMCHADVRSSVITDFGHGDSFFLGGNKHFDKDQSWYNNLASTWQTAKQIKGTVYVPDVWMPNKAQQFLSPGSAAPMKLADALMTPYMPEWQYDDVAGAQMTMIKVQPDAGMPAVAAKSNITIRAPASEEITALAPSILTTGAVRARGTEPVQLSVVPGGNIAYTTNDPDTALECADGDIVVRGTLYLRNLKLNASGGCRLYVTGTVFIEGAITYLDQTGTSNLQITSSRAIIMGIGLTQLQKRLINDHRGLELAKLNYKMLSQQIMDEANAIGTLKDAKMPGVARESIDFNGLLLNAPIVHSRYLGNVKGTIIAEAALFAVGAFHFEYDPVFTKTNVFPLLSQPILVVN